MSLARRLVIVLATTALTANQVHAEKKYGPGVTDTEIIVGQTMPYSGPASSFSLLGKAEAAYFAKVNDEGGINGRRIKLLSLDDGYSPPKTVEQTRRLVEQEEVLLIFGSVGSAGASAVHRFMNERKVPHLFLATVAAKWDDPQHFPWTLAYPPPPRVDASLYARYLLKHYPHSRVGVLYQNDDYGRDYLKALKDGLGAVNAHMMVAEASYEPSDPTIDSQLVTLKSAGADTLFTFANPKAAAQAIRKVADMSWKPRYFINYSVASVETVLKPAGLEKSIGIISAQYTKDPSDPQWSNDVETKRYLAWMRKYYAEGDPADLYNVSGYNYAHALIHVLRRCGEELTRENVMRQSANLKDVQLPMLLPGVTLNTSPTDYAPIKKIYLKRFDGRRWVDLDE